MRLKVSFQEPARNAEKVALRLNSTFSQKMELDFIGSQQLSGVLKLCDKPQYLRDEFSVGLIQESQQPYANQEMELHMPSMCMTAVQSKLYKRIILIYPSLKQVLCSNSSRKCNCRNNNH